MIAIVNRRPMQLGLIPILDPIILGSAKYLITLSAFSV